MGYKSFIFILFLALSTQAWSQKTIRLKACETPIHVENNALPIKIRGTLGTEKDYLNNHPQADSVIFCEAATNLSYTSICIADTIAAYDTLRDNLIDKARSYIGINYRYGQSSEKGFDCSGYTKYVYNNFGLELPHSSYGQYKMSRRLKACDAKPGDLVFFITRGNGISHVGIYLGDNQFIHSPGRGRKVSIDTLDAGYYHNHLVGFGSVL